MKILLDDHHGIGDVAMFLTVLDSLKRNMPDSEIHMLIKSPVEQNLVELFGGVSKFYYYDPLKHSVRSIFKLILDLRKNHYDLSISHIGTSPRSGPMLMKAIGCKKTVGQSDGKHFIDYTIPVDTTSEKQRARKNALLLPKIGINNYREESLLTELSYSGIVKKRISDAFSNSKVIAICIGTGKTVIEGTSVNGKKWPDQYWLELIHMFINKGYKILILGGNKEKKERDKRFDKLPHEHVLDLVGELKLAETLEAISMCDLLIAGDTGLGFCSALMDKPTLSLLGPSDPDMAAPYGKKTEYIFLGLDCSPCYGSERMRDCSDRKCMKEITVDKVFEKSVQMLQNGDFNF